METKLRSPYKLLRVLLTAAGLALIADTVFVLTRSSMNLGVIMPAIIGAPLVLLGVLLPFVCRNIKKSVILRVLIIAMAAVYAIFTLLFITTTALILLNSAPPSEAADVVIVLGCGIRGKSPTLTMKYRLDTAVDYLSENPETIVVVSGGQSHDEEVSEASVMRNYLIAHGIDDSRILIEDRSFSTEENFVYSKELIDERLGGDKSIAFITTRFHVFRSELVAKKTGLDAQGLPAKGVWYITFNDYLRECAALTEYFLTGRL